MSIKITIPNSSSDVLTFGSSNTPTAAQIAGIDSGSSNGQLALYTTASGTSTERVRVDASGNVGVGSTTSNGKLTLKNPSAGSEQVMLAIQAASSTSAIGRITYDQTVDTLRFTNMSSFSGSSIRFGNNGLDQVMINLSGNLLVNATAAVTNANEGLGVISLSSTGPAASFKNSAGATAAAIECWNSATSGDNRFITFTTDGYVTRGSVSYNRGGGLTAYNTTSDYRAKTVNGLVQNALSKVALLKPSTGRMNGAEQDIDFFVAHELQEVVPSAVTGDKDELNEDGSPKYQMVDKSALIPLLTAAIQEQQAIITSLTDRITALENK